MGQLIGKISEPLQVCTGSLADILQGNRKRKRSTDSNSFDDSEKNRSLHAPKKKKLITTSQYIYQVLFKEQQNSDISLMAMGKIWKLHKIYLAQSPYFYSMFNGSWKEASQNFVHIKIHDSNITRDALETVFGCMYLDEIEICPKAVVSVLATATLFQLQDIIDQCVELMVEAICAETAIDYYEAACQYGIVVVRKSAFEWLETNLLCVPSKNLKLLKQISVDLMSDLVSSPDLYVMQTEFSLYSVLRTWIYLRVHPNYDPENPVKAETADPSIGGTNDIMQTYFSSRTDELSFLETPDGQPFVKTFRALRTQYLINHNMDLKIVYADKIIPKQWLENHVRSNFQYILVVDHSPEDGPQNLEEDVFLKNCMRLGRVLLEPGYQKWRWTGFNFGLDLILIADSRVVSIRRHHRNEHERLLSLQTKRQFMIRASVTSINAQRQRIFTQKSEILSLSLEKNEEVALMIMDTKLVHPLLISVNLLVIPPVNQEFKEEILTTDEVNRIPISEIGANVLQQQEQLASVIRSSSVIHETEVLPSQGDAVVVVPPSPPNVVEQNRALSTVSSTSSVASSGGSTYSSSFL